MCTIQCVNASATQSVDTSETRISASDRRRPGVLSGPLFVSTYRIRFAHAWQLPISAIANVEKTGGPSMQSSAWFGSSVPADSPPAIVVYSRDARPPAKFEFSSSADLDVDSARSALFDLIVALAFPHSLRSSFALQRREASIAIAANAASLNNDDPSESYDSDLDADLDLMGISQLPCSCHRALSLLDSPPGALSSTPSPSPSPPPPAFSRFVQGLFSNDAPLPEVVTLNGGSVGGGGGANGTGGGGGTAESPSPASTPELAATLNVEEALAETRRLFPRCLRCSGWRVSRVNANGAVCPTYPDRLVVPAALSDNDIAAAASHRSSQRFIVLGYRHAASGGAILRASQPRVGIGGHRHRGDELVVAAARRACLRADDAGDGAQLLIVDARPLANAMANMALGGGYESTQHYVHCGLTFLGIANIHAVKSNLTRVTAACGDDGAPDCARVTLAAGPWLEQLRRLLDGAQTTAQHVDGGGAVLLHCSDGWDRTPQLLILARVLLDSNARTARGLCALLRQQWLALGHKSTERLGLCERGDSKEQSPVLLQLLECLWNVWQQHPSAFEFTPKFLALLLHYSTSVRFASFFGNNERERVTLGVYRQRDASLWRYLLGGEAEREHGAWSNPLYDSVQNGGAPLRLAVGGCDVRLWTAMHRRGIDAAQALEAGHWAEIPLTFDSEGAMIRRIRMLVRSRDDFQIQ
jgi:hypothetical protein